MKKICVYYKNNYLFTTTKYKTIKQAKEDMKARQGETIEIASIPNKQHTIDDIKHYDFLLERGF